MDYLIDSFGKALSMLLRFDRDIARIVWTSLWVSTTSVTLATLLSLPVGFIIAVNKFRGKRGLIITLNTLMSLPTVIVGLLVYSFLCRRGIFGSFGLIYTPIAVIIGQVILASPIITALTVSAIEGADERIKRTALTLGATGFQSMVALGGEMRTAIFAAVIAGFGRVFAEIGVSMMLGGNIRNYTRNITTAIAFETSKGEFSLGLALGAVLLLCAFFINFTFQMLTRTRNEPV